MAPAECGACDAANQERRSRDLFRRLQQLSPYISAAASSPDKKVRAALAEALGKKYELRERHGEGGMGSVYLAREPDLGRVVAIKVLSRELARDKQFRKRFEREARAAAAISHPNVVKVYTVGETDGDPPLPYIIMQYVEGTSLEALLEEQLRLPERRARRILREVAEGLAAAHANDLVHRDIKPGNILIERESGRAFIADFGISAALSPRAIGGAEPLAEEGVVVGTAPYMSPEQTFGEAPGPASDVYSLGVMAYQLLSGTLPYTAHSVPAWIGAHRSQRPAPLKERRPGISDDVARLVERCLEKEPSERPTAAQLAREFLPSAQDEILWPPPGMSELPRLGRWWRQGSALFIGAAVTLLVLLALRLPGVHTAAGWWRAWSEGGMVALEATRSPGGWPVVLWEAAVLASAAVLCATLGGLLLLQARSWMLLRRLGARGWRRETTADALADPDGRTGLLLVGAGEFATTAQGDRDHVRRFRRRAHRALCLAAGWAALVLAVWAGSVLAGRPFEPRGGPPVSGVSLLAVLGPLALLLLVFGNALLQERRASGPGWRRQHSGTFAVPGDAEGEDSKAWYAELPGSPGPGRRQAPVGGAWFGLAQGALILATGWAIVALGLLVTATLLAGRLARRLGPDTAQVAEFITGGEGRGVFTEALQRRESAPVDALGGLLPSAPALLPAYPSEPRSVLGSGTPGVVPATLAADALKRGAAGRIPSDTLRLLAQLAEHPRTRFLRAAARQSPLRFPVEGDPASAIRTALEANAAGAVLAAARGNLAEAEARLEENAAVARGAIASAGRYWPLSGLRLLQVLALLPLAEVARLRGDPAREAALRQQGAALAEAIDRFGPNWLRGGLGLGSDPRDLSELGRLQADSTVPAGFRSSVLEASGDGVCLNPREWLAGGDPARTAAALKGRVVLPEAFESRGVSRAGARIRYCAGL